VVEAEELATMEEDEEELTSLKALADLFFEL